MNQPSLTRREIISPYDRALKHTAKFICRYAAFLISIPLSLLPKTKRQQIARSAALK
jgi:hypothetical protein